MTARATLRKLTLDLLQEYREMETPANPDLLKLHIEAFEDKVLAAINPTEGSAS